jgi:hypothetical protein
MSENIYTTLDLGNLDGVYDGEFPDFSSHDRVFAKAALENFKNLDLKLNSKDLWSFNQILDDGYCTRSLKWAAGFHTLDIGDDVQRSFCVSLEHVFGTENWPKLTQLTLHWFCVDTEELTELIKRLQALLETFNLNYVLLCTGSWNRV